MTDIFICYIGRWVFPQSDRTMTVEQRGHHYEIRIYDRKTGEMITPPRLYSSLQEACQNAAKIEKGIVS